MSANLQQVVNNPNYIVNSKVTSITKTVTGKIIFWSEDTPIVGISEEKDIYLDFGQGTAFLIVERLFVYNFNFLYLTNIDGRPYTPPAEGDFQGYQLFLKEVYADLQSLFVGCCECGGGSSNVEFVATVGALPATGVVDVLYVVKTPPSLFIWNGTAYASVGGGGGGTVDSIVAGDDIDVDSTDPANPRVGVTPNTFIYRDGTRAGFPVTGPIEMSPPVIASFNDFLYSQVGNGDFKFGVSSDGDYYYRFINSLGDVLELVLGNSNGLILRSLDNEGNVLSSIKMDNNPLFTVSPTSKGFQYADDYSSQFDNRSLIDLGVLRSRLFNKAGIPDVDDDSGQGYVANQSLLLDTTSGIIYKCTDATSSAAVWEVYYDPSKNKSYEFFSCSTAIGLVFPASSTRFFAVTGVQANNAVTNSAFAATKISRACIIEGLEVVTTSAQPASGTQVWEIFRGSNPVAMTGTGITVTIPAGGAAGTYTSAATFNLTAGNYISFRQVNNATANSATLAVISTTAVFNNI